jgi:hypothetical protein
MAITRRFGFLRRRFDRLRFCLKLCLGFRSNTVDLGFRLLAACTEQDKGKHGQPDRGTLEPLADGLFIHCGISLLVLETQRYHDRT